MKQENIRKAPGVLLHLNVPGMALSLLIVSTIFFPMLHVYIGPNCPGISGTVTDFFAPSRIPDSFIIVPEVEERRTIVKPLVAQVLASLAVYAAIYLS